MLFQGGSSPARPLGGARGAQEVSIASPLPPALADALALWLPGFDGPVIRGPALAEDPAEDPAGATGSRPELRPPDALLPLAEPKLVHALRAAAHWLQARFQATGQVAPAAVAWRPDGVGIWLSTGAGATPQIRAFAAQELGRELARDPRTRAAGLFGPGQRAGPSGPVHLLVLVLEGRAPERVGEATVAGLMWVRGFEVLGGGRCRWVDPEGAVDLNPPRLGWFAG